jgi:chromosome segregation ATPase
MPKKQQRRVLTRAPPPFTIFPCSPPSENKELSQMANLETNRNGDSRATSAPVLDEICAIIRDALALDGRSLSHTIERIERRSAGATPEQKLRAAMVVLREQQKRNTELEAKAGDLGDQVARLEDEVADLEAQLDGLRAKPARRRSRPNTPSPAGERNQ